MKRTSFITLCFSLFGLTAFAKKPKIKALFNPYIFEFKGFTGYETSPGVFQIVGPDLNSTITLAAKPDRNRAILELEFMIKSMGDSPYSV